MRPTTPAGRWAPLLCALALWGCQREEAPARSVPLIEDHAKQPVREEGPRDVPVPSLVDGNHLGEGGDGKLHVHFLDVGQGDATLIVSPVGKTVLIDAGPKEAAARLANRLPGLLHEPIDLLVLTQPHPDHYGAMSAVVKTFGAKRFLDPRIPASDPGYAALLEELKARNVPIFVPAPDPSAPGEPLRIKLGGGAELIIFWPRSPVEALISAGARTPEVNSLVARLQFNDASLLLAADAQGETERLLLRRKLPFQSTLLRVASHGSDSASTAEFLAAVRPQAAIISVGAGNGDGMPSRSVTERLERAGARVFRTDLDGDVEAQSDGSTFSLSVERPPAGDPLGTEYVFKRDAPARQWVNPQKAAEVRAEQAPARDTEVTLDLSGGDRKAQAASAKAPPESAETFKKVVEIDSSSLIPEGVKAKYATKSKAGSGRLSYVASKNAKVFHFPDCTAAKRIKRENLVSFSSRADAAKGRKPAGDCNP